MASCASPGKVGSIRSTRSMRRATAWRSGSPADGCSWGLSCGRPASSPAISAISRSACRVSFSSLIPIGPWRRPLRNCATTGSSAVSSTSRGPNMMRRLR